MIDQLTQKTIEIAEMKQQLDAAIKEVAQVKTELATSKLENEQLIEFAERLRKKIDSEQKTAAR